MTPTEFLDRKLLSGKPRACWMCGCALDRWTASVDHLRPKSKGGKDRADNYKLACKPCNSARGNTSISKAKRDELKGKLGTALAVTRGYVRLKTEVNDEQQKAMSMAARKQQRDLPPGC